MRNKPRSFFLTKALLVVLCIAVGSVSVAQSDKGKSGVKSEKGKSGVKSEKEKSGVQSDNGKPFQDLQIQIDALQAQINALSSGSVGPIELHVDCGIGESISDALNSVAGNDSEVVVNVSGLCLEDVIITRDDVTIRGTNASSKIQGTFAVSARRGASRINVENITLTGAYAALSCFSGAAVTATNVTLENSARGVLSFFQGSCNVIDSLIAGNNQGLTVGDNSNINLQGSVVENSNTGANVYGNSSLSTSASSLNATSTFRNNRLAMQVYSNGALRPVNLEVVNNDVGVRIFGNSTLFMESNSNVYIGYNDQTGLYFGNMSSSIINSGLIIENNGIGISCAGIFDVSNLVTPTVVNNATANIANCN